MQHEPSAQPRPLSLVAILAAAGLTAGVLAEDQPPAAGGLEGWTAVEHRANVYTYNSQDNPAVAIAPDGYTLVAWGSRRQEQGSYGVYGRFLDPAGRPIEGEIHFNQHVTNNQQNPAVCWTDHGTAWVAWMSFAQDSDQGTIVARRFGTVDSRFRSLGDEIVVNQVVEGDQIQPVVAASGDRILVAWTSDRDGRQVVSGRMFASDGEPLTDERIYATHDDAHAWLPTVAAQPEGRFVLAWAARRVAGPPRGLYAMRIDATGDAIGETIVISEEAERYDIEPAIDADARGNFAVAWLGANPEHGYDVFVRRFDAAGAPLDDEQQVDFGVENAWQSGAAVAVAPDGRFAVFSNAEHSGAPEEHTIKPETPSDVVARTFDAQGRPEGEPFTVNQHRDGRQILTIASGVRRAAWTADDRLVVAWQGATESDGSAIGVTTLRRDNAHADVERHVSIAEDVLAARVAPEKFSGRVPPEYDPFFIPDPPDINPLNPGDDFGFIGFQATGWNPPDPDLAVGPNHIVVAVNGGIRFYEKDGTLTFEDDISGTDGFWGEVGATFFVFDPVCLYDTLSNRYIVATTEHSDFGEDVINIAVSDDDDPNGVWHKYRFDLSSRGGFIDFPNLGVGPDAIYVATDFFSAPTGNYITIFDKSDVLNGDPTTPNFVRTGESVRSLGAVKTYDADAPAQYFATAFSGSDTRIALEAVRDPNGNPIHDRFDLTVPSFNQPPGAEQLGTSNRAATIDIRIKNGVYRDGLLYLAHTIGEESTARVRWYQIDPRGWPASGDTPVLLQSGTQDLGARVHNWFADINVDASGRVGVAFNQSSPQEFISVQRTFRLPDDPAGELREPKLMQESTSPEEGSRWGDYAGVEWDPVEESVFWNHHEYRTSSLRTWIGKFDVLGDLPPLQFTYPEGRPGYVDSDGATTMLVEVAPELADPQPGTGVLWADTGSGFQAHPMELIGENLYEATFPPATCDDEVRFYISAETTEGEEVTDPLDAPADVYTARAFEDVLVTFADDFEADAGWTVENIDLDDGAWERGVPAGDGTRGDPTSDFDGSGQCYLTDNVGGNSDVDGGPTRLVSPTLDMSAAGDYIVSYARWFSNDDNDGDDLDVHLSNDDGATWTLVDSTGNTNGWEEASFTVNEFLQPTSTMRLRFSATDNPNDSVTEAAIDAVEVTRLRCTDPAVLEGVVVLQGTGIEGGVDELLQSDDTYFRVRSTFGETIVEPFLTEVQFGFQTDAPNARTLDFSIESRVDDLGGTAKVSLKNFNTSEFEQVHAYAIGLDDALEEFRIEDAGDFVNPDNGRFKLRVKHVVFGRFFSFNFDSFYDRVAASVE